MAYVYKNPNDLMDEEDSEIVQDGPTKIAGSSSIGSYLDSQKGVAAPMANAPVPTTQVDQPTNIAPMVPKDKPSSFISDPGQYTRTSEPNAAPRLEAQEPSQELFQAGLDNWVRREMELNKRSALDDISNNPELILNRLKK